MTPLGLGLGLGLGRLGGGGESQTDIVIPQLANVVRCWSTRRNIPAYALSNALKEVRDGVAGTPDVPFLLDGSILLSGAGAAYVAQINSQVGSNSPIQDTFPSCPQIYDGTNMLTGMRFDGGDGLRNAADDADLRTAFAGNFSMCAWVRFASDAATTKVIWQCAITSGGGAGFYRMAINNGVIYGYVALLDPQLSGGAALTANTWHLVAITYSDTTLKIYYDNGDERKSTSSSRSGGTAGFIDIGQNQASTGKFTGDINDIMLYNVALSKSQVQELYAAQKVFYGL